VIAKPGLGKIVSTPVVSSKGLSKMKEKEVKSSITTEKKAPQLASNGSNSRLSKNEKKFPNLF